MQLIVNAFYLQEEAARGRLDVVDETLTKARRLGGALVRVWGFNDDPAKLDTRIQSAPGVYHETGLIGLDRVLAAARAHGLGLILPLVNLWNAYGGARQWLAWHGVADAEEGDARFFSDERVRAHYAAHVAALLGRRNRLTGLTWGEDATVYAWELMNEPRGPAPLVDDWVRFAAGAVRLHARQMISAGDEWIGAAPAFLDAVDLASCHLYPESQRMADPVEDGARFLVERAAAAARAGRALIVGELGLRNDGLPLAERRRAYRRWLGAARDAGVAAIGPWLFHYDARPDGWDDYAWYWRDGTAAADPVNRYADLLLEASGSLPPPSR